jgi:hypothetical protein
MSVAVALVVKNASRGQSALALLAAVDSAGRYSDGPGMLTVSVQKAVDPGR